MSFNEIIKISKCNDIHNKILYDLYKIIKKCSIKDEIDLQIMYSYILYNNILSVKDFEYKDKISADRFLIWGMLLYSGRCCCRHITKGYYDLSKFYNFEVYNVIVKSEKNLHSLTGIIKDDLKLVIDITNNKIGTFFKDNYVLCINPFCYENKKIYKYDVNLQNEFNKLYDNNFIKYQQKESISLEYLGKLCAYYPKRKNELENEFLEIYEELNKFKTKHVKKYEYINKNYEKIRGFYNRRDQYE